MRKNCLKVILSALLFLGIFARWSIPTQATTTTWHLAGWDYRQAYTLSQVRPNTQAFINFSPTSQIFQFSKPDATDIRVVDEEGNSLPFVVKNWSKRYKMGGIVVKLLNSSSTIFVYSGNPNAQNAQQPNQVYLTFEQFSGSSPTLWTIINNPQNVSVKSTPWIASWTFPLFSGEQTVNVGPGVIIDDQTIIAASVDSGEIKQSTNLGQTWQTIPITYPTNPNNPFDKNLSPHTFLARFFFKDSQENLYTSFDGSEGIFRSSDRGQSWTKVLNFTSYFDCCPPPPAGCWQYCENCSPSGQECINCSGRTYLERLSEAIRVNPDSYSLGCAAKINDDRCRIAKCHSRCKMGRSMTEFSSHPGVLLAGSYTGGNRHEIGVEKGAHIFKSTDYGQSWTKVWEDPEADPSKSGRHVHFVAADPFHPGRAYAAIGDGAYKAKIIRSDDYGQTWRIIKQEINPSTSKFPYWQPTAVTFDQNCRYYGGDNEWDPIIHKSCDSNEENFEIVFRPRNQFGYFYWANSDSQGNHYFGFLAHPEFAYSEYNLNKVMSFVSATANGGDLWQIVSYLGTFQYPPNTPYSGTFWGSGFTNGTSLISTFEKKPYLLSTGLNQTKRYLEVKPNSELHLNLPDLSSQESIVLEFLTAMKSSQPFGPFESIPTSETLSLADNRGNKQAGATIKAHDSYPGLWYIYADEVHNTQIPFSFSTWYRLRLIINLRNKTWLLCLPEYNYCHPALVLNYPENNPSKLILKSSNTITNLLTAVTVGSYTPNTNVPIAGPEELAPPLTPTPVCPNGEVGNLNCDAQGKINDADLNLLLRSWAPEGPVPIPPTGQHSADLNNDQKVNETDLSILLKNWRE